MKAWTHGKCIYTSVVEVPSRTRGYGDNQVIQPGFTTKVEVTLDLDEIAKVLGRAAARSKGKQSREIGGLAVAKLVTVDKPKHEVGPWTPTLRTTHNGSYWSLVRMNSSVAWGTELAQSKSINPRRFGSQETAQRAADKANKENQ